VKFTADYKSCIARLAEHNHWTVTEVIDVTLLAIERAQARKEKAGALAGYVGMAELLWALKKYIRDNGGIGINIESARGVTHDPTER